MKVSSCASISTTTVSSGGKLMASVTRPWIRSQQWQSIQMGHLLPVMVVCTMTIDQRISGSGPYAQVMAWLSMMLSSTLWDHQVLRTIMQETAVSFIQAVAQCLWPCFIEELLAWTKTMGQSQTMLVAWWSLLTIHHSALLIGSWSKKLTLVTLQRSFTSTTAQLALIYLSLAPKIKLTSPQVTVRSGSSRSLA